MYEYNDLPMESVVRSDADDANGQFIAGWKINRYLHVWSEKWDLTKRMRFKIGGWVFSSDVQSQVH